MQLRCSAGRRKARAAAGEGSRSIATMACWMCVVESCDEEAAASIVTRRGGCAWWSTVGGVGGGGQKGGRARMRLGAKRRVMLLAPEVEMTGRWLFSVYAFCFDVVGLVRRGQSLQISTSSARVSSASKQLASDKATRPPCSSSSSTQFHRQALTTIFHPRTHSQLASTQIPRLELPRRLTEELCPDRRASAIHSPGACPFLTRQPQPLDFVPAWGPCAGSSCHRRYRCSAFISLICSHPRD